MAVKRLPVMPNIVEVLLEGGCDPVQGDRHGNTPFKLAWELAGELRRLSLPEVHARGGSEADVVGAQLVAEMLTKFAKVRYPGRPCSTNPFLVCFFCGAVAGGLECGSLFRSGAAVQVRGPVCVVGRGGGGAPGTVQHLFESVPRRR